MDDPDLGDEVLYFENTRKTKLCMDKHGLPCIFTLHERQITQSQLEDGAVREQKLKYVMHIADKQKKAPNAKHQDPYEVSLVREEDKPWTHSRDAFMKKMKEQPDFTDFKVRAWAHQHLFESRKITADYFTGTKVEQAFRHHHVVIWVGLDYNEESERSAVHNQVSHDVNTEDPQDQLHKLRYGWVRLECFDHERSNDPSVKEKKAQCFKSIGATTQKSINASHTLWRLACAPEYFFKRVVEVANMHADGQVKDQKVNASAAAGGKSGKKPGNANMAKPVDFSVKFKATQKGTPIAQAFFSDLSWVRRDEDYELIGKYLMNVIKTQWSIPEFLYNLQKYKNIKFLRIQIRTEVITNYQR